MSALIYGCQSPGCGWEPSNGCSEEFPDIRWFFRTGPCLALLDSSRFLRFPPEYSLSANGCWNVTLRCISKQLPLPDARSKLEGDPEMSKRRVQLLYFFLLQMTVVCPPNLFTTTFPDQMTIWDCLRAHNRSDAAQAMTWLVCFRSMSYIQLFCAHIFWSLDNSSLWLSKCTAAGAVLQTPALHCVEAAAGATSTFISSKSAVHTQILNFTQAQFKKDT